MAKQCTNPAKKTSIGGQALIEGVMMRGPKITAMAVRHVSGEIVTEQWENTGGDRAAFFKLPIIRGVFNFIDSMRFGYKCLMRSAEMAGLEEEAPKKAAAPADEAVQVPVAEDAPTQADTPAAEPPQEAAEEKKSSSFGMTVVMIVSVILGLALSVGLFIYLPSLLYRLAAGAIDGAAGTSLVENVFVRAVFEGVLRIVLLLAYMLLVSLMKDIRRVFMYHGAEHKTIFCYENGEPLTVENVRKQSRFHPRCGTSFLILLVLVGMLVSMCIPIADPLWRTVIKLAILPLTVGFGYELIKLAGRRDNLFTRVISAPGKWVQRITTKEPDDGMIECAIAAFVPVVPQNPDEDQW